MTMPAKKVTAPPSHYIADRDLPVGIELGAETMPVCAFRAGDRVPVEHVETYGWQQYVHRPDQPDEPAPKQEE